MNSWECPRHKLTPVFPVAAPAVNNRVPIAVRVKLQAKTRARRCFSSFFSLTMLNFITYIKRYKAIPKLPMNEYLKAKTPKKLMILQKVLELTLMLKYF